jgi:hypothetical protein
MGNGHGQNSGSAISGRECIERKKAAQYQSLARLSSFTNQPMLRPPLSALRGNPIGLAL